MSGKSNYTDANTDRETMGDQPGAESRMLTQALPKSVLTSNLPLNSFVNT